MAVNQLLSLAVIALMMAAFVWGRFRYDLVAACALLVALAVGIVPLMPPSPASATTSSSSSAARCWSARASRGPASWSRHPALSPRTLTGVRAQLMLLVSSVTVLSAFIKNIGALAIMIPIAFQFARSAPALALGVPDADGLRLAARRADDADRHLAQHRRFTGARGDHRPPFSMFDFTPVGARSPPSASSSWCSSTGWCRSATRETRLHARGARHPELHDRGARRRQVGGPRQDRRRPANSAAARPSSPRSFGARCALRRSPDAVLSEGDIVLIEGRPEALDRIVAQAQAERHRQPHAAGGGSVHGDRGGDRRGFEPDRLVGAAAGAVRPLQCQPAGGQPQGERFSERLGAVTLRLGDVIVLQGNPQRAAGDSARSRRLPLAERPILLGSVRRGIVPVLILSPPWAPPPSACCRFQLPSLRRPWPWCCSASSRCAKSTPRRRADPGDARRRSSQSANRFARPAPPT